MSPRSAWRTADDAQPVASGAKATRSQEASRHGNPEAFACTDRSLTESLEPRRGPMVPRPSWRKSALKPVPTRPHAHPFRMEPGYPPGGSADFSRLPGYPPGAARDNSRDARWGTGLGGDNSRGGRWGTGLEARSRHAIRARKVRDPPQLEARSGNHRDSTLGGFVTSPHILSGAEIRHASLRDVTVATLLRSLLHRCTNWRKPSSSRADEGRGSTEPEGRPR